MPKQILSLIKTQVSNSGRYWQEENLQGSYIHWNQLGKKEKYTRTSPKVFFQQEYSPNGLQRLWLMMKLSAGNDEHGALIDVLSWTDANQSPQLGAKAVRERTVQQVKTSAGIKREIRPRMKWRFVWTAWFRRFLSTVRSPSGNAPSEIYSGPEATGPVLKLIMQFLLCFHLFPWKAAGVWCFSIKDKTQPNQVVSYTE